MKKPDLQSSNQKDRETGDKWVDNESVRKAIIWGEEHTEGQRNGKEKSGQGDDGQRQTQEENWEKGEEEINGRGWRRDKRWKWEENVIGLSHNSRCHG